MSGRASLITGFGAYRRCPMYNCSFPRHVPAVRPVDVVEQVEKPTMDDENRTFRTRLVAFWCLTNVALIIAIS